MAPTPYEEYVPSYEIVHGPFGAKRYKLVTPVLIHISQIHRFKRFVCTGIVLLNQRIYFLMFFRMFAVQPKATAATTETKAATVTATKAATAATTAATTAGAPSDTKKRKLATVQRDEQYAKYQVCLHQDWRPGQLATICVHGRLFNFVPNPDSKPGTMVTVKIKQSHIAAALQQYRQQRSATKRSRVD